MPKRDVIDAEAARLLAWRFARPDEVPSELEVSPRAPEAPVEEARPPVTEEQAKAWRASHLEEMRDLAAEVRRAWAITSLAEQEDATCALAERLATESTFLAGLDAGLVASRLVRLLVRHWDALPDDVREEARRSLAFMPLDPGPELEALLEEIARAGIESIAATLSMMGLPDDLHVEYPTLGARLACVLDDVADVRAQGAALTFLSHGRWPEAVPALRRAARSRLLSVRPYALGALLAYSPPELPEELLVWVLEDIVEHPPLRPGRSERLAGCALDYAEVLRRAVLALAPAGGAAPLVRVVRGDCEHDRLGRFALDKSWALATLAGGYPDVAGPLVARAVRSSNVYERAGALPAITPLDDETARPLLRILAADPYGDTAEAAQSVYLRRFGEACALEPLEGMAAHLLEGPPSEAFEARLAALRGTTPEARAAVAEALLAEAEDREALALLGWALAAGDLWYPKRPGAPDGPRAWARAIVERAGDAGVELLLWLVETYPESPTIAPLLGLEGALAARVSPGLVARARVLALSRALAEPDASIHWFLTLQHLGAAIESYRELVSLLDGSGRNPMTPWVAASLLQKLPPLEAIDAHLATEAARARTAGDLDRLGRLALAALPRSIEAVAVEVRRAVEEATEPSRELLSLGSIAVQHGCLDEAFLRAALDAPDSPRFGVAAAALEWKKRAAPDVEEALFRALDAGPASAAAACIALMRTTAIPTDDPRIDAVLARLSPRMKVGVLEQCMAMDAPFTALRDRVEPLLCSADPEVCGAAYEAFTRLHDDPDWVALLRASVDALSDPKTRAHAARSVGGPSVVERYWLDVVEDQRNEDAA